jgi:TRAP-type uncharacterized transport system substrate-binding protein
MVPTAGTVDNLELLTSGEVSLALVQAQVAIVCAAVPETATQWDLQQLAVR